MMPSIDPIQNIACPARLPLSDSSQQQRQRISIARYTVVRNLSVAEEETNGTWPVSSWMAESSAERGARPAIKEMFGDDDELVIEILGNFIEPANPDVVDILAARKVKDVAGVGAGAHKLKSSSRAVGANAMADLRTEPEEAARADDVAAIEKRIVNWSRNSRRCRNIFLD